MIPLLVKVPIALNQSFSVRTDVGLCCKNEWHHHPEIEIIYVTKGTATARIGDRMHEIKRGDIVLIGSKLPHMLFGGESSTEEPEFEAIVIHFSTSLLSDFLGLPENKPLVSLLNRERLSLDIKGGARRLITHLIESLQLAVNTQRLIYLLQILQIIAESKAECEALSSGDFKYPLHNHEEDRLNKVYSYSVMNYQREITLKEIAEVIHMTPHSFCRYFKSRTNKTYSQLLVELRLHHACKLLQETELSVSEISFQSGYVNFSNFSKHFKDFVGKTPLEYRKSFNTVGNSQTGNGSLVSR